ncbi:hypothetical protein CONPUDRAFT_36709, partial [Coniophora puteana RWD-64-598 SS2]
PLPCLPLSMLQDSVVTSAIQQNPDLFCIILPIDVDCFEFLLAAHPNQSFVSSACSGFCTGIWPFAHSPPDSYPSTWDQSQRAVIDEPEREFLQMQIDKEIQLGRFSPLFGANLLPGMYSSPIHVV